jgi:hypothetical protein
LRSLSWIWDVKCHSHIYIQEFLGNLKIIRSSHFIQPQSRLQELVDLPELSHDTRISILVHPRLSSLGICLQAHGFVALLQKCKALYQGSLYLTPQIYSANSPGSSDDYVFRNAYLESEIRMEFELIVSVFKSTKCITGALYFANRCYPNCETARAKGGNSRDVRTACLLIRLERLIIKVY